MLSLRGVWLRLLFTLCLMPVQAVGLSGAAVC